MSGEVCPWCNEYPCSCPVLDEPEDPEEPDFPNDCDTEETSEGADI